MYVTANAVGFAIGTGNVYVYVLDVDQQGRHTTGKTLQMEKIPLWVLNLQIITTSQTKAAADRPEMTTMMQHPDHTKEIRPRMGHQLESS